VTFDDRLQAETYAHSMRRQNPGANIVVASDIQEVQRLASEKNIVQKNIFGGRSAAVATKASAWAKGHGYLTDEQLQALKKIYEFSKARGFRLGLNERYVGIPPKDLVDLEARGYLWGRRRYGNTYWIPTEKGKKLVEGL